MENKPKLKLVGMDGNAFSILGRAFAAGRKAGWTQEQIDEFKSRATAGDYNCLLATCMEYFDTDSDENDDEEGDDFPEDTPDEDEEED